jgi:hypothetical protein
MHLKLICLFFILFISSVASLKTSEHTEHLRSDNHLVDEEWVTWCHKQGGIVCGVIAKDCCMHQCQDKWYYLMVGESCVAKQNQIKHH